LTSVQLETELTLFLQSAAKLMSAELAQILFEHVKECRRCADLLGEHPSHSEALLESLKPPPEWLPAEREVVENDQREIVTFAGAVLKRLTRHAGAEDRRALNEPLPEELASEFWTVARLENPLLHIALACSATKLFVRSWLATSPVRPAQMLLTPLGFEQDGEPLSSGALVEQIQQYAMLPFKLADRTWVATREVAIQGRLGLPGIPSIRRDDGSFILALTPKGLEARI